MAAIVVSQPVTRCNLCLVQPVMNAPIQIPLKAVVTADGDGGDGGDNGDGELQLVRKDSIVHHSQDYGSEAVVASTQRYAPDDAIFAMKSVAKIPTGVFPSDELWRCIPL